MAQTAAQKRASQNYYHRGDGKAKAAARYAADAPRLRAEALARYYADRDAQRERMRAYYLANREAHKERNRKAALAKRGLTPEEYDALLEAQGGVCAICGRPDPRERRLAVDHSHETGEVRGLLCSACNLAIGLIEDDVDRLTAAIAYLARVLRQSPTAASPAADYLASVLRQP